MLFYTLISIVIIQRITELIISKRNEKWLLEQGAVESGRAHYKLIVMLHVLFFISMIAEYNSGVRDVDFNIYNYFFLVFFIILQILRVWVLKTLGRYWNTRVLRIPGRKLINKGLYKYLKHPNYVIVCCEIFVLPMIFNLYWTAFIFSILNGIILILRIKIENRALGS